MSAGIPSEEVGAGLSVLDGSRVRVTWPNGTRKSGLVSIRPIGPRLHRFHDGTLSAASTTAPSRSSGWGRTAPTKLSMSATRSPDPLGLGP